MHEWVRPFACKFWGKAFTQKGNLRKHMKQHLVPNVDQRKKYKWEHCKSSYTERYNYRVSIHSEYPILH